MAIRRKVSSRPRSPTASVAPADDARGFEPRPSGRGGAGADRPRRARCLQHPQAGGRAASSDGDPTTTSPARSGCSTPSPSGSWRKMALRARQRLDRLAARRGARLPRDRQAPSQRLRAARHAPLHHAFAVRPAGPISACCARPDSTPPRAARISDDRLLHERRRPRDVARRAAASDPQRRTPLDDFRDDAAFPHVAESRRICGRPRSTASSPRPRVLLRGLCPPAQAAPPRDANGASQEKSHLVPDGAVVIMPAGRRRADR